MPVEPYLAIDAGTRKNSKPVAGQGEGGAREARTVRLQADNAAAGVCDSVPPFTAAGGGCLHQREEYVPHTEDNDRRRTGTPPPQRQPSFVRAAGNKKRRRCRRNKINAGRRRLVLVAGWRGRVFNDLGRRTWRVFFYNYLISKN